MNNFALEGDVTSLAKGAWQSVDSQAEASRQIAERLCDELRLTQHHEAYAWAALTCGRLHMCSGNTAVAEAFLAEALGRFLVTGHVQGQTIVEAHLSVTASQAGDNGRALRLAARACGSGVELSDADALHVHMIAAHAFWWNEDHQSALLHALRAYEIAERLGPTARVKQVAALSNLGLILCEILELDLALFAFLQGWKLLEDALCDSYARTNVLSGLIDCYLRLNRCHEADQLSAILTRLACERAVSVSWGTYRTLCLNANANGRQDEAVRWLSQMDAATPSNNALAQAYLYLTQAETYRISGNIAEAIRLAKMVLNFPVADVSKGTHRLAHEQLAICYQLSGKPSQARVSKNTAQKLLPLSLLGSIFSRQIRKTLAPKLDARLSETERQCLMLSSKGQSSSDIAIKLGIKTRTVNFHFSNVLRKLNAINRQEAIAKALSNDLL